MIKTLRSPSKYLQGKGVWKDFSEYVSPLGDKLLILSSNSSLPSVKDRIAKSLQKNNISFVIEKFNKECSKKEIARVCELVKKNKSNVIVGVGGGKTLDTAKIVSHLENIPVVIVPTIASTDAPTSSLAVTYTDNGVFDEYLFLPNNPNMVIVDSQIIANAPTKFLIAGMGDALATYFEARACVRSQAKSIAGGKAPLAAMSLAKLCYNTILENGFKAIQAIENNVVTEALESVIEANTLLSGIGFESAGLAAAHAIHNGFTEIPKVNSLMHGEKVAFGTLVQLVLENESLKQIEEVIHFCKSINLPITLEDLGLSEINYDDLMKVSIKACDKNDTMGNMPFEITPIDVYSAILATDSLCKQYK
ncbi:MAG: glycerol dehydrogenase [Clostridium perfringens]|nr:glycerol dehydrogenase [Clostridium perfringens]